MTKKTEKYFLNSIVIIALLVCASYIIYPMIYNFIEDRRGIIYRDKDGMVIINLDKWYESSLQEYERRI